MLPLAENFHGPLVFAGYTVVYRRSIFDAVFSIDLQQFRRAKLVLFAFGSVAFFAISRLQIISRSQLPNLFFAITTRILLDMISAFVTYLFITKMYREQIDSNDSLLRNLENGRVSILCPVRVVCNM
jgi:hypothetical protein